jgi:hypothetical protein
MKVAKLGQFVFLIFFSKKVSCLLIRMNAMPTDRIILDNKISRPEIAILVVTFLLMAIGLVLVFTDLPSFEWYTVEDGLVEWLTVISLLMASFVCFSRAYTLRRYRSWLFIAGCVFLGVGLFFGAGEEISWGQRIFGIESSDYFKQNNTQGETNLHNLMVGGIKVNRWIFSFLLTGVLAIYVIVMPLLYRSKLWMQRFVTYCGIPLPKVYQIIAFVALFVLSELIPNGKRAELLEVATGFMLFLIIRYPSNPHTFTKQSLATQV